MLKRISNRHGLLWKPFLRTSRSGSAAVRSTRSALLPSSCPHGTPSSPWNRRFAAAAAAAGDESQRRRPRRRKQKYERFGEAKLAVGLVPTTTSLETPFEYSGDSLEDYKNKTELSPWTPVPDSVARKIFDRAIPEDDDYGDRSKEGEVRLCARAWLFRVSRPVGWSSFCHGSAEMLEIESMRNQPFSNTVLPSVDFLT